MACIKGKSVCETCGNEFEWRKHDSQPPARYCSRKCTNRNFGIEGNKSRLFWPTATAEQKFERIKNFYEKKVVKKDGCWGWNGSLDKDGYPQIFAGTTKAKGHRVAYEIYKGKIPIGIIVCHTCDNPMCTNPDHLWLGNLKQNNIDKVKKGRSSKGEDRHNSKLKEDDIRNIRIMLNQGNSRAFIARKFGVHYMSIKNIEIKKTWSHVK